MNTKPKRRRQANKWQEPVPEEPMKQQDPHIESMLKQGILDKLGRPPRLHNIRCHNIFDNRWRVNVWVTYDGGDEMVFTGYKIEHSYFCIVPDEGEIVYDPPIEHTYKGE